MSGVTQGTGMYAGCMTQTKPGVLTILQALELSPGCDGARFYQTQLGQRVRWFRIRGFWELTKLGCCANCVAPARPSNVKRIWEHRILKTNHSGSVPMQFDPSWAWGCVNGGGSMSVRRLRYYTRFVTPARQGTPSES